MNFTDEPTEHNTYALPVNFTKQRNVNDNLGRNKIKDHTKIYDEIEKKIGQKKRCNFGHIRGSKTGVKHEGDCNVDS